MPIYAGTVRHQHSVVPAAVRDFLAVPLGVRTPLPGDRADSRTLCGEFSKQMTKARLPRVYWHGLCLAYVLLRCWRLRAVAFGFFWACVGASGGGGLMVAVGSW